MKVLTKYTLALLVAFNGFFSSSVIADNELVFGSVAMDIPAVMHKRLKPLTMYLSEALKRPIELKLSPNRGAAIADTASGKVISLISRQSLI